MAAGALEKNEQTNKTPGVNTAVLMGQRAIHQFYLVGQTEQGSASVQDHLLGVNREETREAQASLTLFCHARRASLPDLPERRFSNPNTSAERKILDLICLFLPFVVFSGFLVFSSPYF